MISAFLFLFLLLKSEDKIARYIYAVTIWSFICFLITEVLSIFNVINLTNLWLCWGGTAIVFLIGYILKWRNEKQREVFTIRKLKIGKAGILWILFAMLMVFLAIKTVPYNWDSMTYHLARIFHWTQNQSVDYYATSISRQVASPIGAAYVNLHVYVMSGGSDRFINMLQCASFLTNGVLVYQIAKKIGCSRKYCNLATVLFYSMPIAFAEALTTQVDNFSAMWMLFTVYLLIDLLRKEYRFQIDRTTMARVIVLSLCIAFGYLTKPAVGIGLLIFALWLLIVVIKRKDNVKVITMYLIIAAGILLAMLMPGFYRNIVTFGALSSPGVGQRQLIGTLDLNYMLVNCMKNFTFNMPTVWIYNSKELVYNVVSALARLLNVDIDNPAISEDGGAFGVHTPQVYGHDTAVNPVIIYLLVACIILWFFIKKRYKGDIRYSYFIAACVSFIAFCTILKWQIFVSRYMISYMAVLCPAIVGCLELFFETSRTNSVRKIGIAIQLIIYFICAVEFKGLISYHGEIALNESRYDGYFHNRGNLKALYTDLAENINKNGYMNVGLCMGGDSYEYPLVKMFNGKQRIEHVNVINDTAIYEDNSFVPDVIISIDCKWLEDEIICHDKAYEITEVIDENICIYHPTE